MKIEPHLGNLKKVKGKVPHPAGDILDKLSKTTSGIQGKATLPAGLSGKFVQNGNVIQRYTGET